MFFVDNSITCLNSFEVRAILVHKVIKLILQLFYCLAHKDFPERQFIEKVVHQLTLCWFCNAGSLFIYL